METTSAREEMAQLLPEQEEELQQRQAMMKVLVAIDDSGESFYALQWTLENLFLHHNHQTTTTSTGEKKELQQRQAMITVVHVQLPFHPAFIYPAGPIAYYTPTMIESIRKAQEEDAKGIFSRALTLCEQHNVKAETLLIKGEPREVIVEAVEEMHVDLLVVGSRGLGQIKRVLLGSVSDYCVHHAKCSVLVVRPPKLSHK